MQGNATYLNIGTDEDGFTLEIETDQEVFYRFNIQACDLDAFYDQVKGRIGPYLRERDEARTEYQRFRENPAAALAPFVCAPADVDESGGYEASDPKSPGFRERMANIWDNRDKTERKPW